MPTTLTASLLIACLLMTACRSDPVHYHTLTPLAANAPGSDSAQVSNHLLVERVSVPPQVDRSQIVLRQGANGLVILETDWWGASLADEVQTALSNLLNVQPRDGKKNTLRVDVQRFDLVPGQYALLDSQWRLRSGRTGGTGSGELACRNLLQTPAGVEVEDLVLAQQTNLRRLARIISDASNSGATRCP